MAGQSNTPDADSVGKTRAFARYNPPALPPSGKLLRRTEAARLLGVSKSTLRRMEGTALTPVVGPKNVHLFQEEEVRAIIVTRRAHVAMPTNAGDVAADAFALFDDGVHVVDVVTAPRFARHHRDPLRTLGAAAFDAAAFRRGAVRDRDGADGLGR